MTTIAVIAMGEMGSGVARRLVERGARVVTSLEGRSAESLERATAAGVETVTDGEVAAEADILLSIVPPAAAAATAARFLDGLATSARDPIFVDCNAIAPRTLHAIAAGYLARGVRFGDAGIIGIPPRPDGYSPRFYMSGDVAETAERLESLGLETRRVSGDLGDASAVKMAYAGVTKGMQAIGTAMALGAGRVGPVVSDVFVDELRDTQPHTYAWLSKVLPGMYGKAHRWDDEMREIATFLEPERGGSDMLNGAATLYQHVAEDNRAGPESEILTILNAFVKPRG